MLSQSLLPSFEKSELHALDAVAETRLSAISVKNQKITSLFDPKNIDVDFLPYLAYALKVDFYSDNLSEQEKRNLISSSITLRRHKGTKYAIERILEQFNLTASVSEWFEYSGQPYHFKVDIESIGVAYSAQELLTIEKYINSYKNVRSWIESINVAASIDTANIFTGSSTATTETIELELIA